MKYRDGYKYQVAENEGFIVPIRPDEDIETEFIFLGKSGHLIVFRGYAWDGPSGPPKFLSEFMPKWLRRKYLKTFLRGSLAHDALYQLFRQGYLKITDRKQADIVLREICIADGMNKFRARIVYNAVRRFAGPSADPRNKKKIYEAP